MDTFFPGFARNIPENLAGFVYWSSLFAITPYTTGFSRASAEERFGLGWFFFLACSLFLSFSNAAGVLTALSPPRRVSWCPVPLALGTAPLGSPCSQGKWGGTPPSLTSPAEPAVGGPLVPTCGTGLGTACRFGTGFVLHNWFLPWKSARWQPWYAVTSLGITLCLGLLSTMMRNPSWGGLRALP